MKEGEIIIAIKDIYKLGSHGNQLGMIRVLTKDKRYKIINITRPYSISPTIFINDDFDKCHGFHKSNFKTLSSHREEILTNLGICF